MTELNKWDEKYLGIYVHKIIFLNGNVVLGEITPKTNNSDNQVGYKDGSQLKSYGQIDNCNICGTYINEASEGGEYIKIEPNGYFKHYWNRDKTLPSELTIWTIKENSLILYLAKKEKRQQAYKDFVDNKISIENYFTKDHEDFKIEMGTTPTNQKYLNFAKRVFKMK